ncbi:MAG: hypothetical protein KDI90_05580 [Alphaproteobacteria bacterium]|nr:hypothetical protein [Alphaproteobacteria bacterium]MCB9974900.1 hypothetical protein [Rhodospirillales bacterium]
MNKSNIRLPLLILALSVMMPSQFAQASEPVMCTMEAKLCPDGSYVSRTGPNCEFAPCPGEYGGTEPDASSPPDQPPPTDPRPPESVPGGAGGTSPGHPPGPMPPVYEDGQGI